MPHPPSAKRAPIFIRREYPTGFEKLVETGETAQGMLFTRLEYPAAFEKLVETGETVQEMFLSTREQDEMVCWLA